MKLEALTRDQCEKVRQWRNADMQFLRTPYFLTTEMQSDFYDSVVCNRDSKHRYFSVTGKGGFIGMVGLTNIEWENGCAEISIILDPDARGMGYGRKAIDLLLDYGFGNMRLFSIYGEVYLCGNYGFWVDVVNNNNNKETNAYMTQLSNRKYYNGKMYGSLWFSFNKAVRAIKEGVKPYKVMWNINHFELTREES